MSTRALARAHFHFVSAFVRTGREIRLKRTSDDWTMLFERIARSKQSVGIRLFIFTRQSRPDVRRVASTERTNERTNGLVGWNPRRDRETTFEAFLSWTPGTMWMSFKV